MFSWGDKIPGYLRGKNQIMTTVTFTAFFSLVFLLVSAPFSLNPWLKLGTTEAIGFIVLFFVLSLIIVSVSKGVLYATRNRFELTYLEYILWNAVEVVLVCSLYTALSFYGDKSGVISIEGEGWLGIFLKSLIYCFVSLAIPYILCGMYFAIEDKNNTIRLMNFSTVVSDEPLSVQNEKKITLLDNSGALKLSVNASNLIFIESDDNYIKVWYLDSKGALKQYMLRCRLKTIEESFHDSDLVRCHRKYIVNMIHVKVLTRQKDGYTLELDTDSIEPIPVSKTYEENIINRFNAR